MSSICDKIDKTILREISEPIDNFIKKSTPRCFLIKYKIEIVLAQKIWETHGRKTSIEANAYDVHI